jgi:hypothetical protein
VTGTVRGSDVVGMEVEEEEPAVVPGGLLLEEVWDRDGCGGVGGMGGV